MKVCSNCKEEKSLDSYVKNSRSKDGRWLYCKECSNAKAREYRKKNHAKAYENIKRYVGKMKSGVYIVHTSEGSYIGESKSMLMRVRNHKTWNEASPINSEITGWEVLEVVEDTVLRKQREQYWIKKLKPELNTKDYHWGSKY